MSYRDFGIYIRECGSTLYVGWTGMFQMLIQKFTGNGSAIFKNKVEKSNGYTEAMMNK